ncbi:MAG: hypothetical protein BWX82_00672 [Parcubacteria group bacterium ADurb.Bin115]|nr:MAG: hypothetical protein BWX82_00672 [Parcubacteria group bacterium ADurb.Bin115]
MLKIQLQNNLTKTYFKKIKYDLDGIETSSFEERVKLLIIRDLLRLDWKVNFDNEKIVIVPPKDYDKETIRQSMAVKREEILFKNRKWIENNINIARENLADGCEVLKSKIKPIVEICETPEQHKIFRLFRYYWSSPYSEYVGRRIKIIVRDDGIIGKPVIGIAALGSPIIHIPERDNWVGWDKNTRTKNIIYTMDAYVIGALPPYNYILGGKLMSYLLASNEIRVIYEKKYKNEITRIKKRKASDLVCLFTTSLYGKSSQYNRLKFNDELLYKPIGETKGFGTLHLTEETFEAMKQLLKEKNIFVMNKFGDGPSWRMRVIRTVGDLLGFDSDFLLKHSFKRNVYAIPLAKNFKKFLNNKEEKPKYYNYSQKNIVNFWKRRWFNNRIKNPMIIEQVTNFKRNDFKI